jgi:hypothetical protein
MFRVAFTAVLLGSLTAGASAPPAPQPPQVFKGQIKDVRGIDGTLTLTLTEGTRAKEKTFQIQGARVVGLMKAEWKVGDLRMGDWVEVEMAADGRTVQEIRAVPPPKTIR